MAAKKEVENNEAVEVRKEEMVKIMLPITETERDDQFVGINGATWQIQRGVEVEVPRAVYEVLQNTQKMDMLAIERSKKLAGRE